MALKSKKKRVVLGVTGSIASYKAAELARYFIKRGCEVRVVMTESATKFIAPLTFESLTKNPVAVSFWSETQPGAIGHIELADWADVVVIAPASADSIAKIAYGFAESSLLAVVLATKAPVVVAPAMNVNMYEHVATQENLATLRQRGVTIVEPACGELACGWSGRGRLAKPSDIFHETLRAIGPRDLKGKRLLISAGPTREAIDPVRYISNRSSGKMGVALANEAYRRGASVVLVHGPFSNTPAIAPGISLVPVTSAQEMSDAMIGRVRSGDGAGAFDVVVMAAAVADYRPASVSQEKIKKTGDLQPIELEMNDDILREVGRLKGDSPSPILVGFAVETGGPSRVISEAHAKRARKNADLIVGNLAADAFDRDTNQVWIAAADGSTTHVDTARKRVVARRIIDMVVVKLEKGYITSPRSEERYDT